MADDNKVYYYMRVKEDFFDSDEIKILEGMKDGYKYSNLLLKLYLKSLKFFGALQLNEYIPYNIGMISSITHSDEATVTVALKIFQDMGLIEILPNGVIYMLQIQNFIGKSSTEADRKRDYRLKIEQEKQRLSDNIPNSLPQNVDFGSGHLSDICPDICRTNGGQNSDIYSYSSSNYNSSNINLESNNNVKKSRKKKAAETPIPTNKKQYGEFQNVFLSDEEMQKLETYCRSKTERDRLIVELDSYLQRKPSAKKDNQDHYATIQNWYRRDHKEEQKPAAKSHLSSLSSADMEAWERGEFDRSNKT